MTTAIFTLLFTPLAVFAEVPNNQNGHEVVFDVYFDPSVQNNLSGPQRLHANIVSPTGKVGDFDVTCKGTLTGSVSKLHCDWDAKLSGDKFVSLNLNVQFQKHRYFTAWDTIKEENPSVFPNPPVSVLHGQCEAVIVAKGHYRARFTATGIAAEKGTVIMPIRLSNTVEF